MQYFGLSFRVIAFGLCFLIAAPALPQQATAGDQLTIVVRDYPPINNTRHRVTQEPIVEIQDEHHNRVPGAIVVFMLPDTGPSGVFSNGSHILTVTADAQGRAAATGLRANGLEGKFEIRVTASYQGKTGHAIIPQKNIPSATHATAKWATIAAIAAGVIIGGIVATRGSGQTISIKPTTGAVNPPR